MNDGYITKRGLKQLDQNFKKIGLTTIDKFLTDNLNKIGDIAQDSYTPVSENITKSKNLSYIDDRGNGRISNGVRSLEAITKTFKGIPSGALVLFDQVIYDNPYNFFTYSTTLARPIIYSNLGLTEYIPLATSVSPSSIEELAVMADRMFGDMRNLTFTYDKYINEALARCKLVVRASMNYRDN